MVEKEWFEILEELKSSLENKYCNLNYKSIVEFCIENEKVKLGIENFLKICCKKGVQSLKGQSLFDLSELEESLENKNLDLTQNLALYTKAIFKFNINEEHLSQVHYGRSKVLLKLGYIPEAIEDVDIALSYKKSIQDYKKHKNNCLLALEKIKKGEKSIEKLDNSINKDLLHQTQKTLESMKIINSEDLDIPEPTGGYNNDFVSASSYINIFYNNKKGRHVIAVKDIKMGDILFVEKPFSFVLCSDLCHNCCKKTIAPIPCRHCLKISYCSRKCRDSHWALFHSYECRYEHLFISVGVGRLGFRTVLTGASSVGKLKNILTTIKQPEYKEGIISIEKQDYQFIYSLVSNLDKFQTPDMFQYVMTSLLLATYLKNYTNYFDDSTEEKDLFILTLAIVRHITQLICNGHAIIWEYSGKDLVAEKQEEKLGTALYPSASMMNHSCEPSIVNNFYKNVLIVRAARDIKAGEEVYNCYGAHGRRMRRDERVEILKKQYFFECHCSACTQQFDPLDKFFAFKCKVCNGPLVPNYTKNKKHTCIDCKGDFDLPSDLISQLSLHQLYIEEGTELLNNSICSKKVQEALKKYYKSWKIGRNIFYKFHESLRFTASQIIECLSILNDYEKCIKFLRCTILSVEERFGCNSIETAYEYKKLGDAITKYVSEYNTCEDIWAVVQEGIIQYDKAYRIINLLKGYKQPDLEDIKKNKNFLEYRLKCQ